MYQQAPELAQQGERVVSMDELTGVQALERKHPDLPVRPGKVARQEFEYIRHGTQSFIFSFDVAAGEVVTTTAGDTRTEADVVHHVQRMVKDAPWVRKWHIVGDNLNVHISESLVRYVASESDIVADLGIKGKSGVLKSMATQEALFQHQDWHAPAVSMSGRRMPPRARRSRCLSNVSEHSAPIHEPNTTPVSSHVLNS